MQLPEELGRPTGLPGMAVEADWPQIAEAVNEHGGHAALGNEAGERGGGEVIQMQRRMEEGIALAAQEAAVVAIGIRSAKDHDPSGSEQFIDAQQPGSRVENVFDHLIEDDEIESLRGFELLKDADVGLHSGALGAFFGNHGVGFDAEAFKALLVALEQGDILSIAAADIENFSLRAEPREDETLGAVVVSFFPIAEGRAGVVRPEG